MDNLIAAARRYYDHLMIQHCADHDKAMFHVTRRYGHHVAERIFATKGAT